MRPEYRQKYNMVGLILHDILFSHMTKCPLDDHIWLFNRVHEKNYTVQLGMAEMGSLHNIKEWTTRYFICINDLE